jgi:hypothetical protein
MPDSSDVTIGELGRRLSAMEGRMNAQFGEVTRRLDSLQFVPRDVYQAEIGTLKVEVSELKSERKSDRRAIVTALVYPTLLAILTVILTMAAR